MKIVFSIIKIILEESNTSIKNKIKWWNNASDDTYKIFFFISISLNLTTWWIYVIPKNNFKNNGLEYARDTHAAACMAAESEKKSIDNPYRKLNRINAILLLITGKYMII